MATNIGRTLIPNTDGICFNVIGAAGGHDSGDLVLAGDLLGVATKDIAEDEEGWIKRGVMVKGVAKLTTDDFVVGDVLYWDAAESRLTLTSAGNTRAGLAANTTETDAPTAEINLI